MAKSTREDQEPGYPLDDPIERGRFFHMLEWSPPQARWDYTSTRVNEAERPDGWEPVAPGSDWELNVDRWPLIHEVEKGWTRVAPGVLRNPNRRDGAELVAYWRRRHVRH